MSSHEQHCRMITSVIVHYCIAERPPVLEVRLCGQQTSNRKTRFPVVIGDPPNTPATILSTTYLQVLPLQPTCEAAPFRRTPSRDTRRPLHTAAPPLVIVVPPKATTACNTIVSLQQYSLHAELPLVKPYAIVVVRS
ncbi:hypothetical protein GW17_00038407 [Ensete ventricosum]|nr:hypothetical protein GW17_00038407 [Ensete ventricosum]